MSRLETLTLDAPRTPAPATPARKSPFRAVVRDLDISALWNAYFVSRDESLRNKLLVHYMPLARSIARQMHTRMPASIDFDDLAQAAILGMRSALATFDPSREIPFERFCGTRVRGAVLDHLRSMDWAPRMLRSRVERVREMIRQVEMSTGSTPTDDQLSGMLNMPATEVREILDETAPAAVRAGTGRDDDSEGAINLTLIPDQSEETPELSAQRADLREFLVRGLSNIERQVIMLYYYESLSLREIGETLDLCESRVSQIHQGVIKRMRERVGRIGGSTLAE
jgi:RNA polymerase sigma factor FliA